MVQLLPGAQIHHGAAAASLGSSASYGKQTDGYSKAAVQMEFLIPPGRFRTSFRPTWLKEETISMFDDFPDSGLREGGRVRRRKGERVRGWKGESAEGRDGGGLRGRKGERAEGRESRRVREQKGERAEGQESERVEG